MSFFMVLFLFYKIWGFFKLIYTDQNYFTIGMWRIQKRETNLTKEVKDLTAENHKTVIKETEDDSKKWEISHALGLEELILLK